jgi:hypothetical protein
MPGNPAPVFEVARHTQEGTMREQRLEMASLVLHIPPAPQIWGLKTWQRTEAGQHAPRN